MRPRLSSASHRPNASIENGNTLGQRPVVRQSKLYRQNESGNAMKAALGYDDTIWDTEALEGVFSGQGVYDAEHERIVGIGSRSHRGPQQQRHPARSRRLNVGASPEQQPLHKVPPRRHSVAPATAPTMSSPSKSGLRAYFFTPGEDEAGVPTPPSPQPSCDAPCEASASGKRAVEAPPQSALELMRKLKALRQDGQISESEFESRRAEILEAL